MLIMYKSIPTAIIPPTAGHLTKESNAWGFAGGGGMIAVGIDSYIRSRQLISLTWTGQYITARHGTAQYKAQYKTR